MVTTNLMYWHSCLKMNCQMHFTPKIPRIVPLCGNPGLVDSACGYAALSLMPPGHDVLTIEYKVNFLSPARGESFIATGRVIRSGRTITVCQGEVQAQQEGSLATIAVMQASMIALAPP